MDAHATVDKIVEKEKMEKAKADLIALATEDIKAFIDNCVQKGFRMGMKVGFWAGLIVALIIYLATK